MSDVKDVPVETREPRMEPKASGRTDDRVGWSQVRRTIAFLVALALLLIAARGGVPRPLIVVAFVVFAVLATL